MQKGSISTIFVILILIIAAVLFLPLPYYQNTDLWCESFPPRLCKSKGWHLRPSLWREISGDLEQTVSHIPTPPLPPEVPSADETANWKAYTNTKFNFSIKYPTDVYIDDTKSSLEKDKGTVLKFKNKDVRYFDTKTEKIYTKEPETGEYLIVEPVIGATFFADFTDVMKLDQIVNHPNEKYYDKPLIYEKITINNNQAYRFEYINRTNPRNIPWISTLLVVDKHIYKIDVSSYEITQELRSRYDQILSTFRFIE